MLLTVLALANLVAAEGGYNYDVPSVPFHLPSNLPTDLQAGQSSRTARIIVNNDLPEKTISYTILPNNNNANSPIFTPAVGPLNSQYTHSVNSGIGAIVNEDSNIVSNHAIDNFNQGSVSNLSPVVSTNVESQNTLNDFNEPDQNINLIENSNKVLVPNYNLIGGNLNNGYAQISNLNVDAQRLNLPIGANLNHGYEYNFQSNLASSHSDLVNLNNVNNNEGYSLNLNNGNLNSAGSTILNNYNQDPVQIYTNRFNSEFLQTYNSPVGVNFNKAITQNLIPPLETVPSTGSLPLQNLNNVNTNTFPPTNSAINSGFSLEPISNAVNTISNGVNNIDIPNIASAPPAPIVTKNIYFHVPPPDIEEPRVALPPSVPIKRYKIIFIKVPSQESINTDQLRFILNQQNTAVETKTLIYVLQRKPELSTPVVAPQRPYVHKSDHEVFFVKYSHSPEKIASEINDELAQTDSVQSIVPVLRPGLANGHRLDIDNFRGDQGQL